VPENDKVAQTKVWHHTDKIHLRGLIIAHAGVMQGAEGVTISQKSYYGTAVRASSESKQLLANKWKENGRVLPIRHLFYGKLTYVFFPKPYTPHPTPFLLDYTRT
jgi:hypothetical protein